MLRGCILDMAREKEIVTKFEVDFKMYFKFLQALEKSYDFCKDYDADACLDVCMDAVASDLVNLLNYVANCGNTCEPISLRDVLSDKDRVYEITMKIPEYLIKKFPNLDEEEFYIFKQAVTALNKSIRKACSGIKKVYAEHIIKLNNVDEDGNIGGWVLLRSVQSLKKYYFDECCSKYTISTRVMDTKDTEWYERCRRPVALLYDFDWQSLICMCTSDLVTDNGHKINYEQAVALETLQEKLFLDYQLDPQIGLCFNWIGAYPAIPAEMLGPDNEILFTITNQPVGIVISKEYYERNYNSDDYAGVKAYSAYAELPVYHMEDGKYIKIV